MSDTETGRLAPDVQVLGSLEIKRVIYSSKDKLPQNIIENPVHAIPITRLNKIIRFNKIRLNKRSMYIQQLARLAINQKVHWLKIPRKSCSTGQKDAIFYFNFSLCA